MAGGRAAGEEGGGEEGAQNARLGLAARHEHAEAAERVRHVGAAEAEREHRHGRVADGPQRLRVHGQAERRKLVQRHAAHDSVDREWVGVFQFYDESGLLALDGADGRVQPNEVAQRGGERVGKGLHTTAEGERGRRAARVAGCAPRLGPMHHAADDGAVLALQFGE